MYYVEFDYVQSCDEILEKFDQIAIELAQQYGPVPVIGSIYLDILNIKIPFFDSFVLLLQIAVHIFPRRTRTFLRCPFADINNVFISLCSTVN